MLIPAGAGARSDESLRSDNIRELVNAPIEVPAGDVADGSDLAFKNDLVIAGSYSGTAIYKILKSAPYVKQIGFHNCPGGQGDVSVYDDLVFVSLDSNQSSDTIGCKEPSAQKSAGKQGLRILDISDPTKPRQIAFVETPCGSHTHTIYPVGGTVYAYVQSYPLGAQEQTCSVASHRKVSIVKVPLSDPTSAKVDGSLDVSPEIGCHDVTIFEPKKLGFAACIGESQVWDLKDPAKPVIISRIVNPSIEIHHGTGVSWDGKILAIADEFAGSVTGECAGAQQSPIGALWFYDVTDPTSPVLQGYYNVPRGARPDSPDEAAYVVCTSHNFNVIPMKDEKKYIASVGYRSAGFSIVDFSDPTAPKEAGFFQQMQDGAIPDVWATYWYNGRLYANDNGASRGLSVYEMKGLGRADTRYFDGLLNPQVQSASFE
jgi:hypothetical protein